MSLRVGDRKLKTLAGEATRPTASRVREAVFNIWQSRVRGCRWLDLCAGSGAMGAEALLRGAEFVVGIEQAGAACQLIKQNWQQVCESGMNNGSSGDRINQLNQLNQSNQDSPTKLSDRQDQSSNQQPWQLYRGDVVKVLAKLIKQINSNQNKSTKLEQVKIASNSSSELSSNDRNLSNVPNAFRGKKALTKFDLVYFDPPYQSNLYLPVLNLLPELLAKDAIVAAEHARNKPLPDRVGRLEVSDRRTYGSTGLTFYTLINAD
jgi:16S rRNA G966 N2-methylase RsmD